MERKTTLHIVPHTHWDREWYFSTEEYRYRLLRAVKTLVRCLETGEIPYFEFDGQTVALEDFLAVCPEYADRVRALTASGALRIGPWYTQPNTFMSGAEAQVRNLLRGRDFMRKMGAENTVNYQPDQFGYNAQLPQFMRDFSLSHLVGSRGLPKGCDTYFLWEGSDGTVVPVAALIGSYGNAPCLFPFDAPKKMPVLGTEVVQEPLADHLPRLLEERKRAIAPHILAMNGADHLTANTAMQKTLKKIRTLSPEISVTADCFPGYLAAVEASLEKQPLVVTGELRDPRENVILPASQSTRTDIKKRSVRAEDMLIYEIEPLLARLSAIGEEDLPYAAHSLAWDYLLQNHAHDSLCGSNCEQASAEIAVRYGKVEALAREIRAEADGRLFRRIAGCPDEAILVENPLPCERDEPVVLEIAVPRVRDYAVPRLYAEGKEIPTVILSEKDDTFLRFVPFAGGPKQIDVTRFTVVARPGVIPPLGYRLFAVRGGEAPKAASGIVTAPDRLENEFLSVVIRADGTLDVTDKRTGRVFTGGNRFADDGECGNGFEHMSPAADRVIFSTGQNLSVEVAENDPLRGVLRVRQEMPVPLSSDKDCRAERVAPLSIRTDVILRAGVPYVEFLTEIENRSCDHRLRVLFPTDIASPESFAGQPFDVVTRPVRPSYVPAPDDREPFAAYHPMHGFCGITDGQSGVAVAADGLMEYEVSEDRHALTLTLLRATDKIYQYCYERGEKLRIPSAQMVGKHSFRYALIPFAGEAAEVIPVTEAFRHPLTAAQKDFLEAEADPCYVAPAADLPTAGGFLRVDGGCVFAACKPASDGRGTVVRLYNPTEKPQPARVSAMDGYTLVFAAQTTMAEDRETPLAVTDNAFSLTARPKEILSLRLCMRK